MPEAPSLSQQFMAGANPIPFAIAVAVMGVVMLAFPKAAVPLGILIVLGALMVDRKSVAAFQQWQSQKG